jgi:hypothetical protein
MHAGYSLAAAAVVTFTSLDVDNAHSI